MSHRMTIMEHILLAFVVICFMAVDASSSPERICRDIGPGTLGQVEKCRGLESCLEMHTVNNVINGIYFKRGTSGDDAHDQYCTSLLDFDVALQDSWDFLQQTGCSRRNNVGSTMSEDQHLVTAGFWNESRSFLRSLNDIVCSRLQQHQSCPETPNHDFWRFLRCFRDIYLDIRPGLVQMLVRGPGKHFDRQTFCRSVFGLKECMSDTVAIACNTITPDRHDVLKELLKPAMTVSEMANCEEKP